MQSSALNHFLAELTSFAPQASPLAPAGLDWEELAIVVERQGLGAIVSYQLDYRFLARVRPPPWLRERLLMTFNGLVNDNLIKVTQLRKSLSEEGVPPVVILGGIALIDAIYPHLAFRPLPQIDLWLQSEQLPQFSAALAEAGLMTDLLGTRAGQRSVAARLADPDIDLRLWPTPPGVGQQAAAAEWERKIPLPAYGPIAHRLDPADAVCAHLAALALAGFAVPRVLLVDLREMVLRSDLAEGFYAPKGAELRGKEVARRARQLGLSRALWAGLQLVAELFPEAAAKAGALQPQLQPKVALAIKELIVRPALDPHRSEATRGVPALRRLLLR